jgi:YidC/Oxa1 family membrane protein insertase
VISILLIIATGWYQARQTMARQQNNATASPINSQMQFMTKVFPVLFGVFSLRFASGLVVYWVTSNTWRIGQQHLVLNKIYDTANAKPVIRSSGDDDTDDIEVEPDPPPRGGKGAGSAGAKASGGAAKKPTGNAGKPQVRRPGSPLPPRDAKRGNGTGTGAAAPATSGNRRKKRKR